MRVLSAMLLLAVVLTATHARADTIVVIVSTDSTMTELTREQLADIYLGRLSRWPDGSRIVVVDLRESDPAREAFYARFLNRTSAQIRVHWSRIVFAGRGHPPRPFRTQEDMVDYVAGDPHAVGYAGPDALTDGVRALRVVD